MKQYVAVGIAVLAGAAVVEAALIPGLVIGGAALLAPKLLPTLRRHVAPLMNAAATSRPAARRTAADGKSQPASTLLPALGIKQAIAKTVTFRVIVTVLDFTSNYVVIGEFNVAAGLSTFALVVGPLLYLAHESAWNYLAPVEGDVDISSLVPRRLGLGTEQGEHNLIISRALAKTITFRTIATAIDYTALYVATADPLTAAGLAAWGFVVGPFVYWGHEKFWERYSSSDEVEEAEPVKLLPALASA